jgi:hypothetical protein
MKNEFLPYQIALDMKSIGFNEPCFAFYNNAEPTPYVKQDFNDELREIYIGDFEAPIYRQVFRWFREKYNLISSVAAIYKDETRTDFEFRYYIQGYEDEELFYETYEEAELECVKKLIKLCKNN